MRFMTHGNEDKNVETRLADEFQQVSIENANLFIRKQHDYGTGNIAKFGVFGVLIRISDKVERLINLEDSPVFESVEDSWRDIAVYANIALLCLKGKWPGVDGYPGDKLQ